MVKSCDSIQWRYTATSLRSMQNPARDAKPLNTDKALVLAHHWLYWCASGICQICGLLSDRHGLRPQYAMVPRHTPGDI
ncbi:hypothetical protein N7489_005707 [Penicillium chrysogenum]|uniref:Uncharacterized protein n=1 Tax=Penicillium chrysogenum TaxID=5076 RepID=A0ABQ8WNJ9_PENCH|nr:uncharacterized protein N7489_005707 [Penicillium chrysogenum]KAJ5245611.1 hypothetical protein N7489_005707 [Penicillium chrysogenum]KAJ5274297.1 hypothetical protein N7505_002842 [Penicillium chrysogenum]KAJ5284761.1 hypothetical protein N7524_000067 [Penicillium chrysogenum]KAJ6156008.1 hypothetical protein N7497_004893 [Penicillium chrysogenum]